METNAWPLVSVIVNNFGGTHRLERCLSSVQNCDYPSIEIIVVDCLTQAIEKWVAKNFPNVQLIHFDYDIGPSGQRNAGLKAVNLSSKYIVFLDNDTEVDRGWLGNLVEIMEADLTVGAVQPLLLKMHEREKVDRAGGFFDPVGYACIVDGEKGDNISQFERIREIFYAETAAMMLRRQVLNELPNPQKPFDAEYFIHWEDIDLSWLIWLAGYRVILMPKSIVYHERRGSSKLLKLSSQSIFLNTRNRVMTLIKNYGFWNLTRYLPILITLEFTKSILLLRQKPNHAIATITGVFWNLRNLKSVWKKRLRVQQFTRRVPDSDITKRMVQPDIVRLYRDFKGHYSLKSKLIRVNDLMKHKRPRSVFDERYFESSYYKYGERENDIKLTLTNILKWANYYCQWNILDGANRIALDVGCAYGYIVNLLRHFGYEALGIDVSPYAVNRAKNYETRKEMINFVVCDAHKLPFKRSFRVDLITCFGVLEHLTDPVQALKNMYKLLKPDGAIVADTPNKLAFYYKFLDRDRSHISIKFYFDWKAYLSKLSGAKFKIQCFMPVFPYKVFNRHFILKTPFLGSSTRIFIQNLHINRYSDDKRLRT